MLRILSFSVLLFFVIFFLSELTSCKDTQTGPKEEIVFPDSNVTFSLHVGPLLEQKCTAGLCHSGSNPAANLSLTYPGSYNQLISYPNLVIPGGGDLSGLVLSLKGIPPWSLMPPAGKLNDNQINGVKKWIDEGAQNN